MAKTPEDLVKAKELFERALLADDTHIETRVYLSGQSIAS